MAPEKESEIVELLKILLGRLGFMPFPPIKYAPPGQAESSLIVPSVMFPIDPAVLKRVLQSSMNRGQAKFTLARSTFTSVAGTTTVVALANPEGSISVFGSEFLDVMTSMHDPLLTVQVMVDSENMTINPVSLSQDARFPTLNYWRIQSGATITVINGSLNNAVITIDMEIGTIEKSLLDSWWMAIMNINQDVMRALAEGGIAP